jgi:hypothetical protein
VSACWNHFRCELSDLRSGRKSTRVPKAFLAVTVFSRLFGRSGIRAGWPAASLVKLRLYLFADQLQRVHDPFVRHQPPVIQLAEDAGEAQLLL